MSEQKDLECRLIKVRTEANCLQVVFIEALLLCLFEYFRVLLINLRIDFVIRHEARVGEKVFRVFVVYCVV